MIREIVKKQSDISIECPLSYDELEYVTDKIKSISWKGYIAKRVFKTEEGINIELQPIVLAEGNDG